MAAPKTTLGKRGEDLAAQYLVEQGYSIVCRNWHCPLGELDIIAQQEQTLVFVEVKTSRTSSENAFANLTPRKQAKMLQAVYAYLDGHQLDNAVWRLDAIAVTLPHKGSPHIEHGVNAFDW
jgi:putative endonuclease